MKEPNSSTNKSQTTLDNLAMMIAKGFEQTSKDIQRLDEAIAEIKEEIRTLSNKLTIYLELSEKRYLELKRRDLVMSKWIKQIADKTGVQIDLAELEKF